LPGNIAGKRVQQFHETGSIRKKWKNRVPVALIYPNRYGLGMSNLGFQLVYHLLNQNDSVVAERVFFPEKEAQPLSRESGRPLADFPLLFFSVSFEHDYQHLVMMLKMAGIAPLASERAGKGGKIAALAAKGQPLVVAGGVATFMNPEPLAPFVDLFIVGEAEPVLGPVMERILSSIGAEDREELLAALGATVPGCYPPALYQVTYDADGTLLENKPRARYDGLPDRISKVQMDSPGSAAPHSKILSSGAEFSDLFMVELGRGCSRGCRFCAAGFIYRPPRLWSAETIINAIDARPEATSRVGLLGMEMARPQDVAAIAEYLSGQDCSLSFSSLRADIINSPLLKLLGSSGLKSAAVAPDGASERLRLVINKGITEPDVLTAVELLAEQGIGNIKLYFMIGLPTESRADLEEMVTLVLKARKKILTVGRARGRLSTLTLSINCFIPKPWTPFQFHPMEKKASLKEKLKFLRSRLGSLPNVRLKTENPEKAVFQALLSRGDRRVGRALLTMLQHGCTWRQALALENINVDDYILRQRKGDELFPWEIIDHGIKQRHLWAEYQKALDARTTPACDTARCKRCGVC
jgi:radical SAM superfamily enzyme YgiQ (UPF0313 family)